MRIAALSDCCRGEEEGVCSSLILFDLRCFLILSNGRSFGHADVRGGTDLLIGFIIAPPYHQS